MSEEPSETKLIIPGLRSLYDHMEILAYPMVRAVAGLWLVPHGGSKLFGWYGGDITKTAGFFSKVGFEPALPLAYYVGTLEFFGGLMIAIGFLTRFWAIQVIGLLAVAGFVVHWPNGFFWADKDAEYPLMWGVIVIAVFIEGGGPLSLDRTIGREF